MKFSIGSKVKLTGYDAPLTVVAHYEIETNEDEYNEMTRRYQPVRLAYNIYTLNTADGKTVVANENELVDACTVNFSTVMTQVARFNSLAMAESYKNREQGRWIVLGDSNEYWVCTYKYARKLVAFGYEMLEG
jgi:hypothetical protein